VVVGLAAGVVELDRVRSPIVTVSWSSITWSGAACRLGMNSAVAHPEVAAHPAELAGVDRTFQSLV
jgi:hypothetical protein